MQVAGGAERGPAQAFQHRFLFRRFAVIHKEVVDLVFGGFGKILAPDDRIAWDQRRLPDHLQFFELLWRGGFQLVEVFGVVGRHIHLLVGDGQRVGFMPGVDGALEVAGGDIVFGEDVVAGDEEARGGVRIAIAEGEIFTLRQQIVQVVDRTVFVDDQHAPVTRRSIRRDRLGEDLAIGAIHRFHRRQIAVPGDIHFIEAHPLDNARVVRGKEGVDLYAQLLLHIL